MYTMIQCPKCHRQYETGVSVCDTKSGGCGWAVPQETPAVAPTETDLEQQSEENAIDGGSTSG